MTSRAFLGLNNNNIPGKIKLTQGQYPRKIVVLCMPEGHPTFEGLGDLTKKHQVVLFKHDGSIESHRFPSGSDNPGGLINPVDGDDVLLLCENAPGPTRDGFDRFQQECEEAEFADMANGKITVRQKTPTEL